MGFQLTGRVRGALAVGPILLLVSCATIGKLNMVSEEQELEMGAQFSQELAKELKFIDDPEVAAYIDKLGQSLAAVSERNNIPYHIRVVDTDEVNAFAVPGGYLYVNRGLIEEADNESELAGVMGHEIGHIVGRHSARQMTQQYGIDLLAQLALGQQPNQVVAMTAGLLQNGTLMHYSRDMESEADDYGVQELFDAGIDPNGLPTFFEKLAALEAQAGGGELDPVSKMFTSHPPTPERIARTRAAIANLAPKSGLRTDSPEFQKIKKKVSTS